MSSSGETLLFVLGTLLAGTGVAWGLFEFGVSTTWIGISMLLFLGIALTVAALVLMRRRPSGSAHVHVRRD